MILIVDDEQKLANLLARYLMVSGYETHWLANGLEVIPWLKQHGADLIVLDINLPGRNGLDVCRELRRFSDVPVVIVTADGGDIARVVALELRADYVRKPFSPRELKARIDCILGRRKAQLESAQRTTSTGALKT